MRTRLLCLLFLFLWMETGLFAARNVRLRYESISIPQGFSTPEIYCTFQDKEGYIWFGSGDGLCRWDGYQIRTFKSDYRHPDLLTHNWVNCIAEDAEQNLWIGTQFGLDILNKKTGRIRHFAKGKLTNQTVCAILVTRNNDIYVGTNFGLNKYIPETDSFQHYYSGSSGNSICGNDIKTLLEDDRGDIWIGTWVDGLCRYSVRENLFISYPRVNERNSVYSLFQDRDKNIWIGSWECGLTRIVNAHTPDKCQYVTYEYDPGKSGSLSNNTVYSISQDNLYGYIWVGTPNGLNVLTDINRKDAFLRYDRQSGREFSDYELSSIYRDRSGIMWLGFNGSGVKKVQLSPNRIQNYSLANLPEQYHTNSVFSLFEYPDDIFWLGTKLNGIVKYDRKSDKYIHFPSYANNDELNRQIKTISSFHRFKNDDRIWATSFYSGIYIIRTEGEKDTSVQNLCLKNTPSLVSDCISTLFMDKDNNLWVGARGINVFNDKDSLIIYDIEDHNTYNKKGIQTDSRTSVLSIIQDKKDRIWLGTENNGVYQATIHKNDLSSIRFTLYNRENGKINNNNIQQVFEDRNGVIWAGTKGGGLSRYNPDKDLFEIIGNVSEIPGDVIMNILEDNFDNLWLSTNHGLVRYNANLPKEQQIKIFTSSDGLEDNVFNRGAFYKNRHGEMFFGGYGGFNSFYPERIKDDRYIPNVVITDIKIFNKSIEELPSEDRLKMSDNLPNYSDMIRLFPDQYNFRIEFSALSFSNAEKNRYSFMLKGFDTEWQYVDATHRYANYNNLSPGKYLFCVKASNESGFWNDQPKELIIEILPAFYQTWWAKLIYVFIVIGLIYLAYHVLSNRMKVANALKIQEMEHAKIDELNQSKLKFFTNISHELLTPLTVLSCAVDQLRKTYPDKDDTFETMKRNINRLMRLLQQILEFRKAETGNLKLKVSYGDVAQFIISLCNDHFKPLSDSKQIDLQVESFPESIYGWFDPDKLDKIIYNLLSNAFKYNFEGGSIHVIIQGVIKREESEYDSVIIRVNNTGQGIAPEAIPNLFKRFYEGEYRKFKTKGTGIGLSLTKDLVDLHQGGEISVKSQVNKYTEFTVTLPLLKSSFTADQIDDGHVTPQSQDALVPVETRPDVTVRDHDKPTLLVIEDNPELLHIICNSLEKDYNVFSAVDGQEGLKLAIENNPDLVVSDIMMPGISGYEVCKTLKGDIKTCHIPVILLTAKIGKESQIEGFEAGADIYITKPFEFEVLEAQIRSLINNRNRMVERFRGNIDFQEVVSEFTSLDEQFLKKAIRLIENNISNPDFNLTAFQEEMCVTSSMLYRKFKALTGMPPLEFIRKIRLEAAVEIMKRKKCSTSEIAYAVGYNDPKYFSNSFKKVYGMLPSEYMEKYHSGSEKKS